LVNLPIKEVLKNVAYIFISFKAKIFYDFFGLWKFIIFISRKLHLIPEVLSCSEKSCQEKNLYFKYPNTLAYLWLKELEKIDFYNEHRIKLAKIYEENLWKNTFPKTLENTKNIYLRFVYFLENREELKKYFRQNNILLWDWYQDIIAPRWTILEKTWYKIGTCKNAEKYASFTLNLPNHIWVSESEALKVVSLIKKFEK
jgi:dTDP-4-amino-4,6-dideoxygalactose transaminase